MSNIKIGEYIHASYRNYREYGLSKQTPQSVNISSVINNQTQAIKDRARSKFKNRDSIRQDLEEKLNGISVAQLVGGFINTIKKETSEEYMRGRILTNREADIWDEYLSIGTVEEFKDLKEKKAKWGFDDFTAKFGNPYRCSNCDEEFGYTYNYCPNCGCDMYAD